MFKLEDVSKYYHTNGITSLGLRHINLEFHTNEIIAITGESGGGKSTLLNVITKMDTFDDGEIYYYGNETSYFNVNDMDEFRKNKVGFIFQNYNIIDSYTVLENVLIPLILKGMSRNEALPKALELIEKVGLTKRIKHRGTKLSGGEKQRCVIARALASDCNILACDEPTGNLDSKTGMEIIKLIKEVSKDKLVLIVTHNFEQVKDIATRKIVIHDGEVKEDIKLHDVKNLDQNTELNLDYEKTNNKTCFKLAKNNLFFTPKKTFLSLIVFFFIALFGIVLYQSTYYTTHDSLTYTNSFGYKGDNKLIVYSPIHQKLDLDKLKDISDDMMVNYFYEKRTISFNCTKFNDSYYGNMINLGYEKNIKSYQLAFGNEPKNENEILLVFPTNYQTFYNKEDLLNSIIKPQYNEDLFYIVSGIALSNDVARPLITKNDTVLKLFQLSYIKENYLFSLSYNTSDGLRDINTSIFLTTESKSYISVKNDYQQLNSYSFSNDNNTTYPLRSLTIDKIVKGSQIEGIYLSIYEDIFFDPYEVALYGDTNKMINQLKALGYQYIEPSSYSEVSELEFFITNIMSYLSILFSSLSLVIIYFITYVILAKIYESKKKDYTILRTLGMTKLEMKKVVIYEMLIQMIIVSLFCYLGIFVLGKVINNQFFIIFKDITLLTTLIYFGSMILFSYLMAKRFNYRLFKFSVNKTFKQDGMPND